MHAPTSSQGAFPPLYLSFAQFNPRDPNPGYSHAHGDEANLYELYNYVRASGPHTGYSNLEQRTELSFLQAYIL